MRILLVEDTEINQRVAQGLLECDGHQVTIAGDGYSALLMHNNHNYDLVLMDIHLPDMDGMETTQRIRQHTNLKKAQVPVIALTASMTAAEINQYQAAGINTVIGKPLLLSELRRTLDGFESSDNLIPTTDTSSSESNNSPLALLDKTLLQQHQQTLGDEKFQELIGYLNQQCEELLHGLATALEIRDLTTLANKAHKLSGACANFGLTAMSDASKNIEKFSHQEDPQQLADRIEKAQALYERSWQLLR